MTITKKCRRCGKERDIEDFRSIKDPDKYTELCGECRDKKRKRDNSYHEENKEYVNQRKTEYYEENKASILNQRKTHYENNKEIIKKNVGLYQKSRRLKDPSFKIRQNISSVIFQSLRLNNSSKFGQSVMEYLPYTMQELKMHLASQFESWMTWDNHGVYKNDSYDENDPTTWTWHIDHVIPQSKLLYFNMQDDNFQKCWSLSNLRPLKSIDNLKKGNR